MFLRELKQPVSQLKGVGPAAVKSFASLGIYNIADLLQHFPRSFENRKDPNSLSGYREAPVNTVVTVTGQEYFGGNPYKKNLKVHVEDESGSAELLCFGRNFLADKLQPGQKFFIYGSFQKKFNSLQCSSFTFENYSESPGQFGIILPVYPLAGNLNQNKIRQAVREILKSYAISLNHESPAGLKALTAVISRQKLFETLHFPEDLASWEAAAEFFKWEELFHLQLIMGRQKLLRQSRKKEVFNFDGHIFNSLLSRLPFSLTTDQRQVIMEIKEDMSSEKAMSRLIQGDVGSGKTLIAFLAACLMQEKEYQTVLMAPTELLARQHAENASKLLMPVGLKVAYLSGNVKQKDRRETLNQISNGHVNVIIGTHAVFSRDVKYRNLGLVIVDEQHRFGVNQRKSIMEKGDTPDILLMTATPIPRTLALTSFGDMDVSLIKTMPPGRKPVETHLVRQGNEKKVYEAVRSQLTTGRQAYFVYPLIESSGKQDLKDAQTMFVELQNTYPEFQCGLIHSRMDDEVKKEMMDNFADGTIQVLVATSVVEVGVDVANATVMVIEHAERFGLSALHQLRGRVGRSELQSYAFLIYSEELSEEGKQRMLIMKKSHDGFLIAEEDLKIRGPGEIMGMKQSGYLKMKLADLANDFELLKEARDDVTLILEKDRGLISEENSVLRIMLDTAPPFSTELTRV